MNAMRTLARTLVTLPLLAASLAYGGDTPPAKKESNVGSANDGSPYLTKEQLRNCMTEREKLKDDDTALKTEQASLAAQKEAIANAGEALKARLETIDRTNSKSLESHNSAVQARDKDIDAFEARVEAFNTRIGVNQAAHSTFSQGCSNRRYLEEDEAAIKKGK